MVGRLINTGAMARSAGSDCRRGSESDRMVTTISTCSVAPRVAVGAFEGTATDSNISSKARASSPPSAANNSSNWSTGTTTVRGAAPPSFPPSRPSYSIRRRSASRPVAASSVRTSASVTVRPPARMASRRLASSPSWPVSAARSQRNVGNTVKWSLSRRRRGSKPARRNEDLPAPEAPRITYRRSTPRSRTRRRWSTARTMAASRPKKTAASGSSNADRPRYGERSG